MHKKSLSVVIPCFNEEKNIYNHILKIHSFLEKRFFNFEIIAVNDGSFDNTQRELEKIQTKIPLIIINHLKNKGKGAAVREGIKKSNGEIVMFLDADLAIPIEELDKFLPELEKGNDIVIASRFVPGLKVIVPVLWYRKIMERVFRFLRMLILNNWKIKDTQCGFKVFNGNVARRIFSISIINRFAFDAEIIFIAKKLGYQIKELPITLQNPITSSVRFFYDPLEMLLTLFKIRINDLSGKYKWKQSEINQKF